MGLDDYKNIVSTCATISTIGHMLTGTLICKDIHKKETSKDVDPMPFLGGIGLCTLMLCYAWILGDPTMININVFGLLTNTVYMAVYYYYSPSKNDTIASIGKAVAFVAVFVGYTQIEHPEKLEYRFGIIVTILFLLLVASPLVHFKKIIETKDTTILPFPLIVMGTIVSFQWLLYGFIINNVFVINMFGLVLCMAQLSLFIIFPSTSAKAAVPSQEKKKK